MRLIPCLAGVASAVAVVAGLVATPVHAATTTIPASAGCGKSASPGTTTIDVPSQGSDYGVLVHVPSGYRPSRPTALVFNLHGSTSSGEAEESDSGMDASADRHGYVVAYPNGGVPNTHGVGPSLPDGYFWNIPGVPLVGGLPVPPGSRNDVRFLMDTVRSVSDTLCIDQQRIYATGASGGARMASLLGCVKARRFAAIAPVMGVRAGNPDKKHPSRPDAATCLPARPMPVLAIHGEKDPVDPYQGGGSAYWGYSVPTAMERWAVLDGCGRISTHHPISKTMTRLTWPHCRGAATVSLYRSSIGGHTWPGHSSPPLLALALGPVDYSIDANEVIWRFFRNHPLPAVSAQ